MAMALNAENDIFASSGKIKRVTGGPQTVQDCRSRLLSYYGEWFLDTTFGVPYFEYVFVKPADLGLTESLLKTAILETPGVVELVNFEMDFDTTNRLLTVSFSAETEDGNVESATINIAA